jgi:hypothetical protein
MEFVKMPMPESLKILIFFFKKKINMDILKKFIEFNEKI